MKNIVLLFAMIFVGVLHISGQTVAYPFPNHTLYVANHIKPDNYTQSELDNHAKSFYDDWILEYLKNDCGNTNEYYVYSGNGAKNVSEAQGYGMMITAYFAGYDVNAQTYFNGLYNFYKAHPSIINSNLMDWQQVTCSDNPSSDDDAASDGDIDIAFALLLAHFQWGSSGTVDYLSEAYAIINAIMQDEINHNTWTVKLGDWCDASDPNYFYGTRPSDFIIDHFRAFSLFVVNSNWLNVIDTCYSLIENIQTNYSPVTALVPDFIINVNSNPSPAGAYYLEDVYDSCYYYNACRVPWRLGTDYLINGDLRAKLAVDNINTWLMSATSNNVNNISNGYQLNGTALYNWNDATFTGPLTVGAMADINNQQWLNNLYQDLISNNNLANGDYYSNTIKLLSLIVISGNYWVPDNVSSIRSFQNISDEYIKVFPSLTNGIINIRLSDKISGNRIRVKLLDYTAKVVVNSFEINNNTQIDISDYDTGLYIILFETNKKTFFAKKVIKE